MNCPSCGKEMERGKIITSHSRGLFFLPPGGDIDALFLTRKYIQPADKGVPAHSGRHCAGRPLLYRSSQ